MAAVSQENVEIAGRFMPGPKIDLAELLRGKATAAAWMQAAAPMLSDDFECELTLTDAEPEIFKGIDGLREAWLEWIGDWHSYRSDVDELIDADDRVLALIRDRGRPEGDPEAEEEPEATEVRGAAVFTIHGGLISRIAFFADPDQGLARIGDAAS
jgi:hypothetical protein